MLLLFQTRQSHKGSVASLGLVKRCMTAKGHRGRQLSSSNTCTEPHCFLKVFALFSIICHKNLQGGDCVLALVCLHSPPTLSYSTLHTKGANICLLNSGVGVKRSGMREDLSSGLNSSSAFFPSWASGTSLLAGVSQEEGKKELG